MMWKEIQYIYMKGTSCQATYNSSYTHTHIHTATTVSTLPGDSQMVGSTEGDVPLRDNSTLS